MIRRPTVYIEKLSPLVFCGKVIGYNADCTAYEAPFETTPTTGDIHDYTNCASCQNRIATITKILREHLEGTKSKKPFPLCCKEHAKLLSLKEFNQADFAMAPEMTANKIIYTYQHIVNNVNEDNWYKITTDYIEWTIESFGQIPKGYGSRPYLLEYLNHITDLVKVSNKITEEKRVILLEYLKDDDLKTKKNGHLQLLINTYQTWYKLFPFGVNSYFGDLKEQYKKLPIVDGQPEANIYSGVVKVKLHTRGSLIELLFKTTQQLLDKIDAPALIEAGVITDYAKHRIELENENLKLATSQITKDYTSGELKYVNALQKWLKLHKEYFREITPLLKGKLPEQLQTKADILKIQLAKYGFMEMVLVKQLADEKKERLIDLIADNDLPYQIAMLNHLGFLQYMERTHFTSQKQMCKEVSKWLGSDKDGRNIKGNINVLNPESKEDRKKFTAHLHKETVQKDLQSLK